MWAVFSLSAFGGLSSCACGAYVSLFRSSCFVSAYLVFIITSFLLTALWHPASYVHKVITSHNHLPAAPIRLHRCLLAISQPEPSLSFSALALTMSASFRVVLYSTSTSRSHG